VIKEKAAAKAQYEEAKRAGQGASLVDQERPNIFTTSVANIPPGAAITVEIEYQHALRYDGGQFRLRFPMVVGPRYIPGNAPPSSNGTGWAPNTEQVPDASRITPPVAHPSRGAINPVSLLIELDPGAPPALLESPYHEIHTTPLAGGRYRIELARGAVPADRDFELVWQPHAEAAPVASLFTEKKGGETFALLLGVPPGARRVRRRAPAAGGRLRHRQLGLDARGLDRPGEGGVEDGAPSAPSRRFLQRYPLPPHDRCALSGRPGRDAAEPGPGRPLRQPAPRKRRHRDAAGAPAGARRARASRPLAAGDLPDRRRRR